MSPRIPRIAQVDWREGLFLQPQHFQQMQKGFYESIRDTRRFLQPFHYGIIQAEPDRVQLRSGVVHFEKLHAIMPSGVEVELGENCNLSSLPFKEEFGKTTEPLLVVLCVPRLRLGRNTGAKADDLLYTVEERQCEDETTGGNSKAVAVRMLNASLRLGRADQEESAEFEHLPLLRIIRPTDDARGIPAEDEKFIPPCFAVHGSPRLSKVLREIVTEIETHRKKLAEVLSERELVPHDFRVVAGLGILNRYGARLRSFLSCPSIFPFQMYLELRDLLSELSSLHPKRDGVAFPQDREQQKKLEYNHANPADCFQELIERIPRVWPVLPLRIERADFEGQPGRLTASLAKIDLSRVTGYYLGITTGVKDPALTEYATDKDRFKLMAKSAENEAITGIPLHAAPEHVRLELPRVAYLFELTPEGNPRMWTRVQADKAVVLIWENEILKNRGIDLADAKLTLFMPVRSESTAP